MAMVVGCNDSEGAIGEEEKETKRGKLWCGGSTIRMCLRLI